MYRPKLGSVFLIVASVLMLAAERSALAQVTPGPAVRLPSPSGGGVRPPVTSFVVRGTGYAAAPAAPIEVRGRWLVYLASEAFTGPAGTDLNGDADVLDQVAVAVNMSVGTEVVLGVATREARVLGDEVYLVVEESEDGIDWNSSGGASGFVLLHWSDASGVVSFIDELQPSTAVAQLHPVDGRLYYAAATPIGVVDETSLRHLSPAQPTTPMVVKNQIGGGLLDAALLLEDEGLLFLSLDELTVASDLNGDGDTGDRHVLGLLDGLDANARVKNVELALADDQSPMASASIGAHDWLVAFLVDEAHQGLSNLNDQALFPQPLVPFSCLGTPDVDASDEVLHYLRFAAFVAGAAPAVNAGIAGHGRVLLLPGFVATISPEADVNCDLNGDGDLGDEIARWEATTLPVQPNIDPPQLHALETAIPGGARGLSCLDSRLVAVVSEARDSQNLDGKLPDHDLVAWLEPGHPVPSWDFTHQHPAIPSVGTGVFDSLGNSEPYAGTSWMAAAAVGDRLAMTFLERVPGTNPNVGSLNTNLDCTLVAKDVDKVDALPVWCDFETGPTLDFDGLGYAVDAANAGVVIASGYAFFRVSEPADNVDHNGDGDKADSILFRNPLTSCGPVAMSTSSSVAGDVIETDGQNGAGLLSSESQAGVDWNGDGDTGDLVVRYFLF